MATSKGERRRALLTDAARSVLVSGGLDAVSHRAVAAAAGVPLGATTYYFTDLGDLRRAAVDASVDADLERMRRTVSVLSVESRAAEHTAELVTGLLTPAADDELLAWYERYVGAAREPLFAAAARRTNDAAREHVDAVLTASGHGGVLPADVVLAIVDGAVVGALATGGRAPRQAAAGALATVLEMTNGGPPRR
ncbi:TetR family transcriptional regulator [Haloactinopolyspora alba]|uniref:TetR family transcriptional regulator n=1 Tax=Haloactinopolyspora alba TaxID=648780 RepID=A0A2P8EBX8_9ACTN|nr:TetR family transcriptional regulator [Haloactinopolyspora alba]PSL06937.1 TetR family transcriptional regulator [Haloactinopolyspora alba]